MLALDLDVTERTSVDAAVAATTTGSFGGLDALINVAGTINPRAVARASPTSRGRRSSACTSTAPTAAVARPIRRSSASAAPAIVSISSIAATVGIPKRASYSAAKGAIESLTRVLAVEWADAGIRVNAVAPGLHDDEAHGGHDRVRAARRVAGHAADPAAAASPGPRRSRTPSLTSPPSGASYITGQTLYVDGGTTVNSHW